MFLFSPLRYLSWRKTPSQTIPSFSILHVGHELAVQLVLWDCLTFFELNLTNAKPPLVNREHAHDGLTHNPKGRRFKLAVTYGFGGG